MSAAYISCVVARELWRSGATRAWSLVALMNMAMIAVHLLVSGSHHLTQAATAAAVPSSQIMTVATALSMTEVVFAVAVLGFRSGSTPEPSRRRSDRPVDVAAPMA